jgi:gamma-glutamylcyclotransferase (GGCT)/AIG2-like uncharacterized protein YtfP
MALSERRVSAKQRVALAPAVVGLSDKTALSVTCPSSVLHIPQTFCLKCLCMDLSTLYSHQHVAKPYQSKSTTMSHTAFFYGTLMAPQVLHRVIWGSQTPPTPAHASLLRIRPAILHAHRRHKVKHADYPAILPTKDSAKASVRGTLVEGLTDGDIWRLDIFEGSEYKRRKVQVRVLETKKGDNEMGDLSQKEDENVEGEEVDAETYIWTAGANRLEQEEWDFAEFVKDKMKHWVGEEGAEADEGFRGRDSIRGARRRA